MAFGLETPSTCFRPHFSSLQSLARMLKCTLTKPLVENTVKIPQNVKLKDNGWYE
jgi:hypothetical protein